MTNTLVPMLREFVLLGLHGYKNLAIGCKDNVAVVLAENGVGKTTLLNVLYALLSGRISRLNGIDFREAILTFDNGTVVFNKESAIKILNREAAQSLMGRRPARELIEFIGETEHLYDLLQFYVEGGREAARRHTIFRKIYRTSPWDEEEIFSRLDRLQPLMFDNSYIAAFQKKIVELMGKTQVLYLPTYRRIEATFEEMAWTRRIPTRESLRPISEDRESDQLIYFGLGDVEEKLERMTRLIQQSMFEAYSRLSGNIFDALFGMQELIIPPGQSFDLASVKLMLGRLGKNNNLTELEIERAITASSMSTEGYRPMMYFLQQLSTSYEDSRPYENAIEDFVFVVNGYFEVAQTDKRLRFDKMTLKVDVLNLITEKTLPLGSLSSGEKQIVSLFSRLILDGDKKYFVLIDEPELSLSIEWQRKLLPDILASKNCAQLLAITHSPFVFENSLDIYARSMYVSNDVSQS